MTQTTTVNNGYRGIGNKVAACNNDPKAILAAAKLDWRVGQARMGAIGHREVRDVPTGRVMVRSDNEAILGYGSSRYKVHQNADLINTLCRFANETGLRVTEAGCWDGGARIWAAATSEVVKAEAKVGDVVSLQISMRSGHTADVATMFNASALRLVCLNGATLRIAGGVCRFRHSSTWGREQANEAGKYVAAAAGAFNRHMDRLKALYAVHTSRALDLTYLLQLLEPKLMPLLTDRILRGAVSTAADSTPNPINAKVANRRLLDAILERDESIGIVRSLVDSQTGKRTLNAAIMAYDHQPGGNLSKGTLAHPYNGITHYNSNVRGTAEAGLESNYWGEASETNGAALDLALEYTTALSATPSQMFA